MPRFRGRTAKWLNYEVAGAEQEDLLILLHPHPLDARVWIYQMAHLSQHFRVVALDFPGYGKSGPVRDKAISVKDLAEDVRNLFSELGADSGIVGGLSVGGVVALQFALDYQPQVKALILSGCPGKITPAVAGIFEERIQGYRRRGLSYRRQHLESLVTGEFASSELGRYVISLFLETNASTDVDSIVRSFEALLKFDGAGRLHDIKVPTLLINGEKDMALASTRELSEGIPGSIHKIIKGAAHACAVEKPWEFDRLLLDFLMKQNLLPKPFEQPRGEPAE